MADRKEESLDINFVVFACFIIMYDDSIYILVANNFFWKMFEKDLDISSPEIVSRCLPQTSQEPDMVLREAQLPDSKAQLRAQTEEAIRLGIFGAPSFLVNDELFWGNDRLEAALSWETHLNTQFQLGKA